MVESIFRNAVVAAVGAVIPNGDPVFVDGSPNDAGFPHAVIYWAIDDSPRLSGDGGDIARGTQFQVTLRETAEAENGDLAAAVIVALNGVKIGGRRVRVYGAPRQVDPEDANVVRRIITVGSVFSVAS